MAALGYFDDPYLQCFVSKVTRRAPLIHRGYYIRAKTIDYVLQKFLESNHGNKQIISLGAGFDSAFFRLYNQNLLANTVFYEVDFPEVVKRKHALIRGDPDLLSMVGEECSTTAEKSPHIELTTKLYKLLGVDLSQTNTLEAALKICGLDFDKPTLLMSECVLTYMTRRTASAVIKWASETFYNSMFVLYEQINPSDAFGLFMQNHFHTVGSPLKCINYFPSMQSQRERFSKLGWTSIEAMDMNEFYNTLLSQCERDRVEKLELFDEYEEWHLKCAHYMVLLGYRGNCVHLLRDLQVDQEINTRMEIKDMIHFSSVSLDKTLKRFGHDSAIHGTSHAVCVGGFGEQAGKHMRVTDIVLVDLETQEITIINPDVDNRVIEVSRMHGTISCLKDGRLLLIGGRLSPMRLCSQMVAIDIDYENLSLDRPKGNGKDSGDNGFKFKCMNCGDLNFSEEENSKPKNSSSNESRPKPNDVMDKLCLNCSKMNISCGDEEGDKCFHKPGENKELSVRHEKNEIPESSVMHTTCDSKKGSRQSAIGGLKSDAVRCTVIEQCGEVPSPRWRHTAVLHHEQGGEQAVYIYGGRSQNILAFSDCFKFTVETQQWSKIEACGSHPEARQSHTASIWSNYMVIAGGLDSDLQPLNSVFLLDLDSCTWTTLDCDINPRYSHTAHVMNDFLVLIGGVNMSHTPPGVAMIHLPSGISAEFSLPYASKENLVMLHRHSSVAIDNSRILLLGGGGNCFSFGTHLNSSPIIIDLKQALETMEEHVLKRIGSV